MTGLALIAAVFIDWGSSAMPPVEKPFPGVGTAPPLSYSGLVRNVSTQYLAAAIAPNWVVTAGHVSGSVGAVWTDLDGTNTHRVLQKVTVSAPNYWGIIQSEDLVLLRLDRPVKHVYPLSTRRPVTGDELISVGAGNLTVRSTNRYDGWIFNPAAKAWVWRAKNPVVSLTGANSDHRFRWVRTRFIQRRHTYEWWTQGRFEPPLKTVFDDDKAGGGIIPSDRGAGYGLPALGDSGSPVFVLQDGQWRYAFPAANAPTKVIAWQGTFSGPLVSGFPMVTNAIAK